MAGNEMNGRADDVEREGKQKAEWKRMIVTALIIHLFSCLTVVFFSPMEVVLLNADEFHFTFGSFWWFQLLLAFLAAGLLTLITMLLPRKAGTAVAALSLGAGTAAWVQSLFMNGKMIRMTGEQMQVSGTESVLNLLAWAGIAGGIFFAALILERKGKKAANWMAFAAGFLTAIQLTAFISLVATTDIDADREGHSFTRKGEFELSSGTNVVVFLMDAADGEIVRQMMDTYPEVKEQLNDWVYYPDAVSEYSRTFPALTYLFTGEKCFLDHSKKEYVDSAFERSNFLQNMNDAGTDIRIFTMETSHVSTKVDGMIQNIRKNRNSLSDLNLPGLEKGLGRISMYKCLPYACKPWFSYDVSVLNILALKERYYNWKDPYFYHSFAGQDAVKTTGQYAKAFRFYHLWSAHGAAEWNDRLEITNEEEEPYTRLRGSFLILEAYCNEMKKAGVYDDALIIVVADHGDSNGDLEKLIQYRAACPLLMVKYPHSKGNGALEVSKAPVSHEDLFATITDALGAERPNAGSGRAIEEITEGEDRGRRYYYIALDNSFEPILLREYLIRGDAEEFSNWEETGNVWRAQYGW